MLKKPGDAMGSTSGHQLASSVEAMATLCEYMELALDKGGHLVMVRSRSSGTCTLYVGNETVLDEQLPKCGVIQNNLADAILESTESGLNELSINGETYRFMRFFTEVNRQGAVVFAAV
ncbi:hypothetical protein [Trinickia sp.]|uniref:hypothetical protein n=1 Tax=Trinickia sp. TaxID=2571163 RepID=UPI003F81A34B